MQYNLSSSDRALLACTAIVLIGLLAGCDSLVGLTPGEESQERVSSPLETVDSATLGPGIEVALRAPDTVATGDAFKIQARTDNQTGTTVTVVSGNTALYDFGFYDGDDVVPVEGSMRFCAAVQTEIPVEPGESTGTYDLQAVRSSNEEQPIAPGTYTTRLALNWRVHNTVVQDTLAATIVFRDE